MQSAPDTAAEIEVEVVPDAGLPRVVGAVVFTVRQGAAVTTVRFSDAEAVHPSEWLALAGPGPAGIAFGCGAEAPRIELGSRGVVVVTVAHAGGARASTALPAAACRAAFERAAAQTAQIRGPCEPPSFHWVPDFCGFGGARPRN